MLQYKLIERCFSPAGISDKDGVIYVELQDLVGKHELSGVEYTQDGEASGISFTLNGLTIAATEDPEDGYRSSLKDLKVEFKDLKNSFAPIEVTGHMNRNDSCISFKRGGRTILEVGTDYFDKWYPVFVSFWGPHNIKKGPDNLEPQRYG